MSPMGQVFPSCQTDLKSTKNDLLSCDLLRHQPWYHHPLTPLRRSWLTYRSHSALKPKRRSSSPPEVVKLSFVFHCSIRKCTTSKHLSKWPFCSTCLMQQTGHLGFRPWAQLHLATKQRKPLMIFVCANLWCLSPSYHVYIFIFPIWQMLLLYNSLISILDIIRSY